MGTLRARVRRLEIVTALGDLPPVFTFMETRADAQEVTAGAGGALVPGGLTHSEYESWAAELGLKPFTLTFTDPKPRRKAGHAPR